MVASGQKVVFKSDGYKSQPIAQTVREGCICQFAYESGDDLGHVDVGSRSVLGNGTSGEAGNSDGSSETHFESGVRGLMGVGLKSCSWLDNERMRC